jgi:hypothetical protein
MCGIVVSKEMPSLNPVAGADQKLGSHFNFLWRQSVKNAEAGAMFISADHSQRSLELE